MAKDENRVKLIQDAIEFRGQKSAREIAALHGVSRNVVIGIWWRAKLSSMPKETKGRLISEARRKYGVGKGYPRITRLSPMPSQAKLAATPRSNPDWWTEMYLDGPTSYARPSKSGVESAT